MEKPLIMSESTGLSVVVLAGGISHERDVSLRSGRRVADALQQAGHRVDLRDPDARLLPYLAERRPDVVFPALHGSSGEDGSLLELLAAIGVPNWAGLLPAAGGWLPVLWALSVAVAVPLGLSAHRGHEAQSDRRALELGASPDALVRALVKLHLLAAQPRRMAQEIEQGATHPSLARRIQAVRLAAGTAPERLPATVVLAGVEAGRFVVLDDERVHWLAGAPEGLADQPEALCQSAASRESLAYAELVLPAEVQQAVRRMAAMPAVVSG